MKFIRGKIFIRLGIVAGVLVLAAGGYHLLRYQVWTGYRSWSMGRMNGMARNFVATGDARNALMTVRKILSSRPNDTEALRLGVKAADLNSSGDAVLFQRNLCRVQKTTANNIELMTGLEV